MGRTLTLVLGLWATVGTSAALAQPTIIGPPVGTEQQTVGVGLNASIPAEIEMTNGRIHIPIHLDAVSLSSLWLNFFDLDFLTGAEIEEYSPGEALMSYVEDQGEIPCDIYVYPGVAALSFWLPSTPGFTSAQYGTEILTFTVRLPFDEVPPPLLFAATLGETGYALFTTPVPIFRRGDLDFDGTCGVTDAIKLTNTVFNGDPVECWDAADYNDDGQINLADVVGLLTDAFSPTATLGAGDECGRDNSSDTLDCRVPRC